MPFGQSEFIIIGMPDIYVSKSDARVDDPVTVDSENHHHDQSHKADTSQIGLEDLGLIETNKSMTAFAPLPVGVHFETQESQEKIILLLRMHWITNIKWILTTVLMVFVPIIFNFFPLFSFLPSNYQFIGLILWYLLVTAFIIEQFLTWFFNVYIITDERIIDIDFNGLLHREISEAKIDKIQDVKVSIRGIAASLMNYGDIIIQTAGEVPNFDFLAVPNPDKVAKVLQGLRTQEEIETIEGRIR